MDFNVLTPITIGFFTAFIMGPVFWVLLETSITKGFRAAVVFDLGVMFADVCFIAICYFGSMQLLEVEQNNRLIRFRRNNSPHIWGFFMD